MDLQSRTCESEEDENTSIQYSLKSTLQPDNSYLEKTN